jgi:hypothetical protein
LMPPKKRAGAELTARPRRRPASQPSSPRSSPAAATAPPLPAAAAAVAASAPCTPTPSPLPPIAASILSLVHRRGPDKSICPSEVARALFPGDWRRQMQAVRDVAWALVAERKLVVTQVRRRRVFPRNFARTTCAHVIVDPCRFSDRARRREGRRCLTARGAPFGCG